MSCRVGVWGLGSIGLRHARNFLSLGCDVIGFDPDAERRSLLVAEGGVDVDSAAKLLDHCDAVVIATPSGLHLQQLRAAIEAKSHVLIEKPIAHTLAGLDDLWDEAERNSVVVFAAMNMRYHPTVTEGRAILEDGAFGAPIWGRLMAASYLPDWRPNQDYRKNYAADPKTGGVLFDFIHEFDLAFHLLGPSRVVGAKARCSGQLDMSSEDVADVLLSHEQAGVVSAIHVDYITQPRQRRIEIGLEKGVMNLDLERAHLSVWDASGQLTIDKTFDFEANHMYEAEAGAFLSALERMDTAMCSGREASNVLETVIAARRMCGLPE